MAKAEFLAGLLAAALLATAARADKPAPDELPPEGGFLEFLGLLVEDEDGYLDPLDMAADNWTHIEDQVAPEAPKGSEPEAVEDENERQN